MSNPLPNSLALSVINTNDPINSAPLRNDFASVQTAVNQLIACLSGGTAGQLLSAVDGTDVQYINNIRYRKTSAKQVVNTVAETDLLNGEITIGAGAMGANQLLRLTAAGDWIQNSGAAVANPRFKLKFGASTLLDSGVIASNVAPSSAVRGSWRMVCEIQNTATNVQWAEMFCVLTFGTSSAVVGAVSFTTGEGFASTTMFNGSAAVSVMYQAGGAGAVDTTAAQALALTVINPAANAAVDVTLKSALVEIL